MPLIDENKMQGDLTNLLEVLRFLKCCAKVSGSWMHGNDNSSVWVLLQADGTVQVMTSPTGTILTPTNNSAIFPLKP